VLGGIGVVFYQQLTIITNHIAHMLGYIHTDKDDSLVLYKICI